MLNQRYCQLNQPECQLEHSVTHAQLSYPSQNAGFTLMEMVIVIVILGVVSIGVTRLVSSGVQIFVDAGERDLVVSDSRFVIERLNRELVNALPNSVRVTGNNLRQCIEFVPVLWSTMYFDLAVPPEAASNKVTVMKWQGNSYQFSAAHQLVVYATSVSDIYGTPANRKSATGVTVSGSEATFTLSAASTFPEHSPSSRLYVVQQPISYCLAGAQIKRYQNYGYNGLNNFAGGSLMAEGVTNNMSVVAGTGNDDPFKVNQASLTRTSTVLTLLRFERADEQVVFSNEVQLSNVP